MSAARSPRETSAGVLVISRSLGEGFSIGDDWHFQVTEVNARYVTLTVTNANQKWTCRLEVEESLHISGEGGLHRRQNAGARSAKLSPAGVRVARVTSNDARLAVHAPRALKIHRHEHDMRSGVAH
jgi:sRNA-binding carbon storage regulator CsrA